jgi:L-malate glycosyltransferase
MAAGAVNNRKVLRTISFHTKYVKYGVITPNTVFDFACSNTDWPSDRQKEGARMLRIGILCHSSFGGSARIATELAIGLARRGHVVHLFVQSLPFGHWDASSGVNLHIITSHTQIKRHPAELHIDWQEKEFEAYLSEVLKIAVSLDVLHFQYAIPFAYVADEVKRRLGKASPLLVGTLHGTDVSIYGRDPGRGPQLVQALQSTDVLTTVSISYSNLCTEVFGLAAPPQVIPNFVDLKRFHPRDAGAFGLSMQRRPRIAHVSNFRAVKQPQVMANVFSKIRAKMNVELWLIGDGPEMEGVKSFFRQNDIDGDVIYWDLQHEVAALLAQTDLLLVTSQMESFCLAALEAMACGLPVVASRVGGLPEVVLDGKTGLLFDPGQLDQAARSVLDLLSDPERYKQMSESAFRHARNFDYHEGVLGYEELYLRHLSSVARVAA